MMGDVFRRSFLPGAGSRLRRRTIAEFNLRLSKALRNRLIVDRGDYALRETSVTYYGDRPIGYFRPVPDQRLDPSRSFSPLLDARSLRIGYITPVGDMQILRRGILFTPSGIAWDGARIDAGASTLSPNSLRSIWRGRHRRKPEQIPRGTIVQAEYINTYGDWISCIIKPIALAGELLGPLLLPARLGGRIYVENDLARLGIPFRICEHPVKVADCLVLRRRTTSLVWTPEEVAGVRKHEAIPDVAADPGSLIYLSRVGVRSDIKSTVSRDTRSDMVEAIVRDLGGDVVRTEGMSFADFGRLASRADTVVADHGAALFNLLQWRTRSVVELVADDWWITCFLAFSKASGVERHVVLRPTLHDDDALTARIASTIEADRV